MTRTEISRYLRPYRRVLVVAAEKALTNAYAQGRESLPPSKTQFSRLVNLCNEASCAEELENYLRYQAGRRKSGPEHEAWRMRFVEIVLAGVRAALDQLPQIDGTDSTQRDLHRVEAWRLYATYLARAFTYEDAKRRSPNPGRPSHPPGAQSQPQSPQRRDQGRHDQRNTRNHG